MEVVMTMNVSLSPQLEAMVKAKVASGLYTSASEVVREALRLMEQQDQLRSLKLQQLRHDIQEGLSSGQPTSWNAEEIKQGGRRRKASRPSVALGT
jgi:antitoxin ParD1/3/4